MLNDITYVFFHHLSITAINPPSYTTAKTSSSIATSAKTSSRIACFLITPCSGRGCYGAQVPNLLFLHCESSFSQPLWKLSCNCWMDEQWQTALPRESYPGKLCFIFLFLIIFLFHGLSFHPEPLLSQSFKMPKTHRMYNIRIVIQYKVSLTCFEIIMAFALTFSLFYSWFFSNAMAWCFNHSNTGVV